MEEKIQISVPLCLTPSEPGDKHNLVQYLNDPVVYKNTLRIPFPYTEADAVQWLKQARESREEHGRTHKWSLRHTEFGLIGGIGAFLQTGVEGHLDEIGYWLGAPFRGQGIMTEVVRVYTDWLFETRPALARIEAKVHVDNPASARVLEKAGFEREGIARKHSIKNGELLDVILYAKIRPGL